MRIALIDGMLVRTSLSHSQVSRKNLPPTVLLYEPHVRRRRSRRGFTDRTELRLEACNILTQCAPQPLGVSGTDDRARHQLPMSSVCEDIDKVHRKLFRIMVNHNQIAESAD